MYEFESPSPSVDAPEEFGGAWCPRCGGIVTDRTADDYGWCPEDGLVPVEYHAPIVAFAVEAATGEVYAIRETSTDAATAAEDARRYIGEGGSCGHPDAPSWAMKQLPFRVRALTKAEHDEILADGTPTLDREG